MTEESLSTSKFKDFDSILMEPYNYLTQIPGKGIRIKLIKAFNHWLNIPEEKVEIICEIIQMLHNSSLMIDDIEDNSLLRRGIPVAHKVFGIPQTINSANYMYFIVLKKIVDLGNEQAIKVFSDALLQLHKGQGMEIFWRDNFICPNEEEYKAMAINKTSGLFKLAVDLMKIYSTNKQDFSDIVTTLGLYFQIRDDYAIFVSKEYKESKGNLCEDLTEGKFSFPIIHGISADPNSTQIMNILKQRTTDVELKKYCITLLTKLGSFEYTKGILNDLEDKGRGAIMLFGGNLVLEHMLSGLAKIHREG